MRLVERPFLFIQSLLFFVSLECALPFALCRVVAAGSSAGSGTNSCVINHHAGTLRGGEVSYRQLSSGGTLGCSHNRRPGALAIMCYQHSMEHVEVL